MRVFVGQSNSFFEFFRGEENSKVKEGKSYFGSGSGCFSLNPYNYWNNVAEQLNIFSNPKLTFKDPVTKKVTRSSPYYIDNLIMFVEHGDTSKLVVAFDLNFQSKTKPILNDYRDLKTGGFIENQISGLSKGVSTIKLKVYQLSRETYDYLVIMFEFNEQKNSYQNCILNRVRIVNSTNDSES